MTSGNRSLPSFWSVGCRSSRHRCSSDASKKYSRRRSGRRFAMNSWLLFFDPERAIPDSSRAANDRESLADDSSRAFVDSWPFFRDSRSTAGDSQSLAAHRSWLADDSRLLAHDSFLSFHDFRNATELPSPQIHWTFRTRPEPRRKKRTSSRAPRTLPSQQVDSPRGAPIAPRRFGEDRRRVIGARYANDIVPKMTNNPAFPTPRRRSPRSPGHSLAIAVHDHVNEPPLRAADDAGRVGAARAGSKAAEHGRGWAASPHRK